MELNVTNIVIGATMNKAIITPMIGDLPTVTLALVPATNPPTSGPNGPVRK